MNEADHDVALHFLSISNEKDHFDLAIFIFTFWMHILTV